MLNNILTFSRQDCNSLLHFLKSIQLNNAYPTINMSYYNIFEEKEKGSYTPGFFLMKLSFSFDTNHLSDLSTENLSTFAHEYVHFLQNKFHRNGQPTNSNNKLLQNELHHHNVTMQLNHLQIILK